MPAASAPGARAYLDNAATAPFDERLLPALREATWGNASSLHAEGRAARAQLEGARKRIASALGAHAPAEIVFTSGGTESDNTALHGLSHKVHGVQHTYVVVSAIEHDAVLNAAASLKAEGYKVAKLAPDKLGVVRPDALGELLARIEGQGDGTCLVTVQMLNNELGTIQPVAELAAVAHAHGALFFTDAVQALGKLPIALEESGVDAAAFSAHKIGALKGCGALYVASGVKCAPYLRGGGQEGGLRSGTSNVAGAHVFAAAVELACAERAQVWKRAEGFRAQVLMAARAGGFAHAIAPTLPAHAAQAPHILSLLASGLEGETMVLRADNAGVALSSASACSAGSLAPSHVLVALGIPRELAYCSLRVSFGASTTQADVDRLIAVLGEVLR